MRKSDACNFGSGRDERPLPKAANRTIAVVQAARIRLSHRVDMPFYGTHQFALPTPQNEAQGLHINAGQFSNYNSHPHL
jgi:hypothetical protein